MDDREIARLLSGRNAPSVLEKERDFARLMRRLERQKAARKGVWLGLSVAFVAALLVWLLPQAHKGDEFAARGGDGARASYRLVCVPPGRGTSCVPGGKLAFELDAAPALHFAAFARRADGLVLWYWPGEHGATPTVGSFGGKRNATAVMLDAQHPPGTYAVHGVFSQEPLTRAALKALLESDGGADAKLHVIERSFVVEAP